MTPFWQITAEEIIRIQGDSPEFTRVLNWLLSANARGKVPSSSLSLNVKDNEPDGGVDAAVDVAIAGDSTGYFRAPSAWQYKAQPTSYIKPPKGKTGGQEAALIDEINKPHSKRLISKGYGYRFCIADDMPDKKKNKWEGILNKAAKAINRKAPAAIVLTASKIAELVNRYPALVASLKPYLNRGRFQTLDQWAATLRFGTPVFLKTTGWSSISSHITTVVDFSRNTQPFLTIHGEAGVGKSRSACEALITDPHLNAYTVVASDDNDALEFARAVAADEQTLGILVADECSLDIRVRLAELAKHHSSRLRIIALDNSLTRESEPGELRLTRLSNDEVRDILNQNFGHVPFDQRDAIIGLSSGFVRLALDLCSCAAELFADGQTLGSLGFLQDQYLSTRLTPDQKTAVEVVSLLPRVGFKDDRAGELSGLCDHSYLRVAAAKVREAATALKQAPGFIAFAGRYLYVTPSIIAHAAFRSAWDRWIAADPAGFLRELPEPLIVSFTARVREAGTDEMKDTVSAFFRGWVNSLGPPSLGNEAHVTRLVRLVEIDPAGTLIALLALVRATPINELRALHSTPSLAHECRRPLVWLAEGLARFSEHFDDAEELLFCLAKAESEPDLGNNATRVWVSLFRVGFSGTPIPFPDRLRLLERRLDCATDDEIPLLLLAVEEALCHRFVSRLVPPAISLGRITPVEWNPGTQEEFRNHTRAAFAMTRKAILKVGPLADGIRAIVVQDLASHILNGFFAEVKVLIGSAPLSDQLLSAISREVDEFIQVFCSEHKVPIHRPRSEQVPISEGGHGDIERLSRIVSGDVETQVREWFQELVPRDFHGQLLSVIGQEPLLHHREGDSDEWQHAVNELAHQIVSTPEKLDGELSWLSSPNARSAYRLGQAIAASDTKGTLVETIVNDAAMAGALVLARGYVGRLGATREDLLPRLNSALDRLERESPPSAYQVLVTAGEEVNKVERLFRMVDRGDLDPELLRGLEYGLRNGPISESELLGATSRLMQAAKTGRPVAASAAIHLVFMWFRARIRVSGDAVSGLSPDFAKVLEGLLEQSLPEEGIDPTFWINLAEHLVDINTKLGLAMLGKAITARNLNMAILAERSLAELASRFPAEVMDTVGDAISGPGEGRVFRTEDFNSILDALPQSIVCDWIERHGQAGARAIARRLRLPFENDKGVIVVPALTEAILDRFSEDKGVFDAFMAGAYEAGGVRGDIVVSYEREARVARGLHKHQVKWLREWGKIWSIHAEHEANVWQRHIDERNAPQ